MGNTNSFVRHLQDVFSVWMGRSSEAGDVAGSAAEDAASSSSPQLPAYLAQLSAYVTQPNLVGEVGSESVEQQIEQSKSHWSQLTEFDSDFSDENVKADNMKVFLALQSHPRWGMFFQTFGYDTKVFWSSGRLTIGHKFAEGGQAELFSTKVYWSKSEDNERDRQYGREWVLKVFKKGTRLRHLQCQWPCGMLKFKEEEMANWKSSTPKRYPRFFCSVDCGTLLKGGRFAFLMKKEHLDLRRLIDDKMKLISTTNSGPFSKCDAEELMFDVALGMSWLHNRDIVHRDLKASNVLVKVHVHSGFQCFVADYECSIGVVGTGLFRAPEILEACRDDSVSKRPELFTMASDAYSYGMTCYEILTGKLPFDGHLGNDYVDVVISGKRPEVPKYVEEWVHKLLSDCWQHDPAKRPSFGEIVNLIYSNSFRIGRSIKSRFYRVEKMDWIKLEGL
ncbi:hypothetical protein KC19_2G174600 [Ceratodon purpureus]|uniref:Protein kinase domain-containing protein n=1 Tax=Ceratodon purpureus TaxID=3225 RepID=A0A8T0IV24_CERPU|nr:hypothetical protein KC19_2G174600 [Ceratodon purpureus]